MIFNHTAQVMATPVPDLAHSAFTELFNDLVAAGKGGARGQLAERCCRIWPNPLKLA